MPYFTNADRNEISKWLKFQASPQERDAVQKEFKIKDSSMQRYVRGGKSGRDIIPARFADRSTNRMNPGDRRKIETLRALAGGGLTIGNGKEDTIDLQGRSFKTFTAAVNELNRIMGRVDYDKNGDTFIKYRGVKTYVHEIGRAHV